MAKHLIKSSTADTAKPADATAPCVVASNDLQNVAYYAE